MNPCGICGRWDNVTACLALHYNLPRVVDTALGPVYVSVGDPSEAVRDLRSAARGRAKDARLLEHAQAQASNTYVTREMVRRAREDAFFYLGWARRLAAAYRMIGLRKHVEVTCGD